MAQKITFVDDLDGSPIDDAFAITRFSLNGEDYEIDLSPKNAEKLAKALEPYISVARKATVRIAGKAKSGSDPAYLAKVREWAKLNNFAVSERGRVAADLIKSYEAAR